MKDLGKVLALVGVFIAVVGIIIWVAGDKLRWFGKLPGDIRIQRPNFSFYMPITTMIIVSIVLSLILYIIQKFMK